MKEKIFSVLQRVGRAFMLPIAILPVAGLLLGIGSSFTNTTTLETYHLMGIMGPGTFMYNILTVMNKCGSIIFDNLPIIFAIGVAIGMAKKEKEVAALAAAIAFLVMHSAIGAMIDVNGGVENGLGGGICQISSTLYNTVLFANLGIVERHQHSFTTSYVDPGRDATVVYGVLDFKFKNTRKYPVKLEAYVKSGVATVSIYGLKEDVEYTVKVVSTVTENIPCPVEKTEDPTMAAGVEKVVTKGTNGCRSVAYKYVYDMAGNLVSKTQLSADYYGTIARKVKVGTKQVETPATLSAPTTPTTPAETPSPSPSTSTTPSGTDNPGETGGNGSTGGGSNVTNTPTGSEATGNNV